MKSNLLRLVPVLVAGLGLTGCVDDSYDLSDIDTNVRVGVNNLVIPVNIDEISLKSVLDLDDDSKIKVVNNEYAFVEEGTFSSDAINIPSVRIAAPQITPTVTNIAIPGGLPSASLPAGEELTFPVNGETTSFSASATNVSSSIVSLEHAGCSYSLTIGLSIEGLAGKVRDVQLRDIVLKFPKGLEIAGAGNSYDPSTGLYRVGTRSTSGHTLSLQFNVTGIDFTQAAVVYDYAAHTISFADELALSSATLGIGSSDILVNLDQLPSAFSLKTTFAMSDIDIRSFSGRLKYGLEGVSISDVALTDLPDVLTQEGTDIRIANPQIYIKLTNPLHDYGLEATTGMEITSYRDDTKEGTYALDAPGYFTIGAQPGVADYCYYLSPSTVGNLYPGYAGAGHVGYASLSNVLSGNGIPTRLAIDFINPGIPEQNVQNLQLGTSLGNVQGSYTFYAPLAFKSGSMIMYRDVIDGWADGDDGDDLEKLTIQNLTVNLNITTNVPVEVEFTGYPVDKNGHQISNVTIEGATIPANASDYPLSIRITGEIRHLDGISFEAKVKAGESESPLSPDMSIRLSHIRPQVSGFYEDEL